MLNQTLKIVILFTAILVSVATTYILVQMPLNTPNQTNPVINAQVSPTTPPPAQSDVLQPNLPPNLPVSSLPVGTTIQLQWNIVLNNTKTTYGTVGGTLGYFFEHAESLQSRVLMKDTKLKILEKPVIAGSCKIKLVTEGGFPLTLNLKAGNFVQTTNDGIFGSSLHVPTIAECSGLFTVTPPSVQVIRL